MEGSYENVKERFFGARTLIKNNIQKEKIKGKICLDVGCGLGNLLLALSEAGAEKCIGVDVNLKEFGNNYIEKISHELSIPINNIEFIENSLESLNYESYFDVITCFDTIEHAENPKSLIEEMYKALKPNGICLIDTSPLYFSPIGSHLWPYFPRDTLPWVHLYKDFDEYVSKTKIDDWSWRHFTHLNKLTHSQLDSYVKETGFKILDYYTKSVGKDDYPKFKDKINHALIPSLEDLFIEWDLYKLTK